MILFYSLFLLLALGGLFLWKTSALFCILLFLAAAAGIALQLLWKKKGNPLLSLGKALPSLGKALPSLLPLPICLVLGLAAGQSASTGGIEDYDDRIQMAASCIGKGDLDGATDILDELDEEFGVTDLSLYARAEQYIALGEYGTALSFVGKVQDDSSQRYYESLERIYNLQDTAESVKKLQELYPAAAADLPVNSHMQYMAGLTRLREGSWQGAIYYFLRARELDATDPMPCYYLGVIYYEQDEPRQAALYFADALERGADAEREGYIKWYVSEIMKGEMRE